MSRNSTAQSMFITKKSSSMRAPVVVCRGSARVRNSAYLSFGRGTFSGTATVVLLLIIPRHPVYIYIASFYSIYVSSSFLLSLSLSLSLSILLPLSLSFLAPSSSRALFLRRSSHSTMSFSRVRSYRRTDLYDLHLTLDRRHPLWMLRRKPKDVT